MASLFDSFLISSICESNCGSYKEAMTILGQFSEIRSLEVRFDKTVRKLFDFFLFSILFSR